ncbi:MAG TPA: sialidase family protein [Thermoanaerobaculia bacterium]|nr:sialidase family protein [Thermoanaerobaculia bacterium]
MKIALLLLVTAVIPKAKAPFIIGDGAGGFYVSYVADGAFQMSRIQGDKVSNTKTIARNASASPASFPSILRDGKVMRAAWQTKNGAHGAMIHLAESADGGATWKEAPAPHPNVVSEFGFVSLLPGSDAAVFLDGRGLPNGEEGKGDMQLRAPHAFLDARVCDCCQTAAVMTSAGAVVAYRDRSNFEVRDISIVRRTSTGWTQPKTLHADGWEIKGCPVNGPQLDARGKRVAAAWFTGAQNDPRVQVAFSEDAGANFSKPVRVTSDKTNGRVDVAFIDDDNVIVTYMADGALHARRVSRKGTMGVPVRIAAANGFPRLAVSKENVGVVWTAEDGVHFQVVEGLR